MSYLREATLLESPLFFEADGGCESNRRVATADEAIKYDSYVRGTYESLNLSRDGIPEDMFMWALGILRSRAQQPMRDGSEVVGFPVGHVKPQDEIFGE